MDLGGLLFDELNATYGCVMIGNNNSSLFQVALGMQSNLLTPDENEKAKIWSLNRRHSAEYLRDIYWVNFIRKSVTKPYEELEKLSKTGEITSYNLLSTGAAFAVAEKVFDFETEEPRKRIEWLRNLWKESLMPKNAMPFKENPNEL